MSARPCARCSGSGEVPLYRDGAPLVEDYGQVVTVECPVCEGSGADDAADLTDDGYAWPPLDHCDRCGAWACRCDAQTAALPTGTNPPF